MQVDAHQHFWNLDRVSYPWLGPQYGAIFRTFEAPELAPQIKEVGIDRTVLVQAMDSYEDTSYMLAVADQNDWIGAVVGWVPLDRPEEAGKKLEVFAAHPKFRGIRHLIHEEKDPDWIVRDEVLEGLKVLAAAGFPFDFVAVYPNHLKHIPTVAERVPNLRMVIDHLGKPPIASGRIQGWAEAITRAAQYPQVYAKISGLNTAADWATWTAEDLKPAVEIALEAFGAQRLMFGSDWPVATLAGDYGRVWRETHGALAQVGDSERRAIFGETAQAFYNIQ